MPGSVPVSQPFFTRTKVLSALGAVGMLTLVAWWQLYRDEPERMPPGFVMPDPVPAIADADNGLVFLANEMEKQEWPELEERHQAMLHWREPWDEDFMRPVVEAAPAMREIVEKALRKPDWQDQYTDDSLRWMKEMIKSQQFLSAGIRGCVEAGDDEAAMEYWQLADSVANAYTQAPRTLAALILGLGSKVVVEQGLLQILAGLDVSDEVLSKGSVFLEQPRDLREIMLKTIAFESVEYAKMHPDGRKSPRFSVVEVFEFFKGPGYSSLWVNHRYKPQATRNLYWNYFTIFADRGFREGPAARLAVQQTLEWLESETELPLISFETNRTGRILNACDLQSNFHIEQNLMAAVAARRCCLAVVAAKRWSLAHEGASPATLEELVPEFLKAVPQDPWTSGPVHWDPSTGTAWTTGSDGMDDIPVIPDTRRYLSSPEGSAARLE